MKVSGKSTTIAGETYQYLRASILSGDIAPGSRVRTNELCTQFAVSLGAVREALTQLMAEGLLVSEAHRAYFVAPTSISDLHDLTRVRIEIENLCLTWSMRLGEVPWEAEVIAATHRLSKALRHTDRTANPDWATAHDAYHAALVSACDSPRLLQIRQHLYEQSERYRKLEASLSKNRDSDEEHARITDAVLARDVAEATRLMTEHLSFTAQTIVKAMSRKQEFAPTADAQGENKDDGRGPRLAAFGNKTL